MMTDLATLVEHKNSLKEIIPKLSIDDILYSKSQLIESLISRLDLNVSHVSRAELNRPGDLSTSKLSQANGAVRRK
jgi:hypothetical protein